MSRVVEKDGALLSGYKFQGSRVSPEYKDDRVRSPPLFKNTFSPSCFFALIFFFFLQKRKTYKKFIYKQKKTRQYDRFIYSYVFSGSSLYFNF